MSRTRTHRRTALRVALGLVVASTLVQGGFGGQNPAAAQVTSTLGGLQGRGAASGMHVLYAPEGLLPISPLAEIGIPDALATISSGPATFARASIADPGDIIANPAAVLALLDPSIPAGGIPPYPYRISASSGIGAPTSESNPAPGLNSRVVAAPQGSSAQSTLPQFVAPSLATAGSISTFSSTITDGSTATVKARSEISGLNLFGVIQIESLVTDVTATSDGTETQLEGGTTIVGATVLGQAVVIDSDGIHVTPGDRTPLDSILGGLLDPVLGAVNELLEAAGITLTLVGPVELAGGTSGQLSAAGLRLDIDVSAQNIPALAALLAAVPPIENPAPGAPSIEDLLVIAGARHIATVEFGRAAVSLTARPPAAPRGTTTTPPASPSAGVSSPSVTPAGTVTPPRASTPGAAPVVPGAPVAAESTGNKLGTGIGAVALLALLANLFVGDRLARLAAAVLGTDHAGVCLREER